MKLLTKKELAELMRVSVSTIERMVNRGQLKPARTNPMIFDADSENVKAKTKEG